MKYVVEYFESERGWGSERWTTEYSTYEEAMKNVNETNDKYGGQSYAPDYYVLATYLGTK